MNCSIYSAYVKHLVFYKVVMEESLWTLSSELYHYILMNHLTQLNVGWLENSVQKTLTERKLRIFKAVNREIEDMFKTR